MKYTIQVHNTIKCLLFVLENPSIWLNEKSVAYWDDVWKIKSNKSFSLQQSRLLFKLIKSSMRQEFPVSIIIHKNE